MSPSRRTVQVVLAIFVAAFVVLYPYLGAMDFCERGECSYAMTQSSGGSAGIFSACAVAALAASFAATLAPALLRRRRVLVGDIWSTLFHLAPDSPPPRLSSL